MSENSDVERETPIWHLTPIQLVCLIIGGVITMIGLMADQFGFGQPGSFGTGQLLLVLVGFVVSLIGLLGKRIVGFYRGVAILLLNTLCLLAILELFAIVIARSGIIPSYRNEVLSPYLDLPYYKNRDWAEVYWSEAAQAENYGYQPYVIWRHLPFEGQTIHINDEGLRETPGVDCDLDAYKVFAFGGSSMWGWGSPDWGTIPAYLQSGLEDWMDKPVCVSNFGEDGFVSTQSLITLMLELKSGDVPQLVIFYDGVNEVIAAYESGKPDFHVTCSKIAAKFEGTENPLLQWLKGFRTYSLIERITGNLVRRIQKNYPDQMNIENSQIDTDNLAESMTEVYLENYKIVGALASEYGFDYFFFLQPHLSISKKSLTQEEHEIKSKMDPVMDNLAHSFYANIVKTERNYAYLWYIPNVLDGEKDQIWIDELGHITPEGNYLVAQEMLTVILDSLSD